jgi:hypothetical protein
MRNAPAIARLMNAESFARLSVHLLGENFPIGMLFDPVGLTCPLATHINQLLERKPAFLLVMILFTAPVGEAAIKS